MKIFDTHTHLNDPAFSGNTQQYIDNAKELDVDEMAIIGSNEEFNIEAIRLAQNYQPLHAVVGWHPEFAKEYNEEYDDRNQHQVNGPVLAKIPFDQVALEFLFLFLQGTGRCDRCVSHRKIPPLRILALREAPDGKKNREGKSPSLFQNKRFSVRCNGPGQPAGSRWPRRCPCRAGGRCH